MAWSSSPPTSFCRNHRPVPPRGKFRRPSCRRQSISRRGSGWQCRLPLYRPSKAAIRSRALAGYLGGTLASAFGIVQLRIGLRQGGHRLGGLRVIGDIGGTNARFALAQNGAYQNLVHVEVGQYASLHDALTAYIEGLAPSLRPS